VRLGLGLCSHRVLGYLLLAQGALSAATSRQKSAREVLQPDSLATAEARGLAVVLPWATDSGAGTPPPVAYQGTTTALTCSKEFFTCQNGMTVIRVPPTCQFEDCPVTKKDSAPASAGLAATVTAQSVSGLRNDDGTCAEDYYICPGGSRLYRQLPDCEFGDCSSVASLAEQQQTAGSELHARVVTSLGDIVAADPEEPCQPDVLECEDGTRVTRHLPSCEFAPCPAVGRFDHIPARHRCHHCRSFVTNTSASDMATAIAGVGNTSATAKPLSNYAAGTVTVTVTVTVTPDRFWGLPQNGLTGLTGTFPPLDLPLRSTPEPAVGENITVEPSAEDVMGPNMTEYDKAAVDEGAAIIRKQQDVAEDVPGSSEVREGTPVADRHLHRLVGGGVVVLILVCVAVPLLLKRKGKPKGKKKGSKGDRDESLQAAEQEDVYAGMDAIPEVGEEQSAEAGQTGAETRQI